MNKLLRREGLLLEVEREQRRGGRHLFVRLLRAPGVLSRQIEHALRFGAVLGIRDELVDSLLVLLIADGHGASFQGVKHALAAADSRARSMHF